MTKAKKDIEAGTEANKERRRSTRLVKNELIDLDDLPMASPSQPASDDEPAVEIQPAAKSALKQVVVHALAAVPRKEVSHEKDSSKVLARKDGHLVPPGNKGETSKRKVPSSGMESETAIKNSSRIVADSIASAGEQVCTSISHVETFFRKELQPMQKRLRSMTRGQEDILTAINALTEILKPQAKGTVLAGEEIQPETGPGTENIHEGGGDDQVDAVDSLTGAKPGNKHVEQGDGPGDGSDQVGNQGN